MMRRLPVVGIVHQPAYALLWVAGIAQEYQLFNWIDTKNYYVTHQVSAATPEGAKRPLAPTTVFPESLRSVLLQTYLRDVRWMPYPREHRQALKQRILDRLAQRFCRLHPTTDIITVQSSIRRIHTRNIDLTKGREQFWMQFQCLQGQAVLCRTFLQSRSTVRDNKCPPGLVKGTGGTP
jgi:hypothetical protein